MILRATSFTIHLKHAFSLALGSRTTTPAVLVEIEEEGIVGYGEASLPPYLGEIPEDALNFLKDLRLRPAVSPADLGALLAGIDHHAPGHHAAKAAIDIALHDWLGKRLTIPVHRMLGVAPAPIPPTSMTIGMGDREFIRQRVQEAADFPVLKVKLGGSDDRGIVGAIREVSTVPLRVDVNQGWSDRKAALREIEWLASQNVELIEQPLPKEHLADLAWLRERSPLPIVADESVQRFDDVGGLRGVVDGINIKLMKCTGLAEAHRMILHARETGLRVMLGCMTETSCAISAAVQLAPLADWVDLDGALLIANDPFTGASIHAGRVTMPEGNGIGVTRRAGVVE